MGRRMLTSEQTLNIGGRWATFLEDLEDTDKAEEIMVASRSCVGYLEATVSALADAIQKIEEVDTMCQLAEEEAHISLSTPRRIPEDVWKLTFLAVRALPWWTPEFSRTLSQVSTTWRAVALRTNSMWSPLDIYITEQNFENRTNWMEVVSGRGADFRVSLASGNLFPFGNASIWERVTHLYVWGYTTLTAADIAHFPNLMSLVMDCEPSFDCDLQVMKDLKRATFEGIGESGAFRKTLTHLHVGTCSDQQVLEVLGNCTALECGYFGISCERVHHLATPQRTGVKVLTLHVLASADLTSMLGGLKMEDLKVLELVPTEHIEVHGAIDWPNLAELYARGDWVAESLAQFTGTMPALKTLNISGKPAALCNDKEWDYPPNYSSFLSAILGRSEMLIGLVEISLQIPRCGVVSYIPTLTSLLKANHTPLKVILYLEMEDRRSKEYRDFAETHRSAEVRLSVTSTYRGLRHWDEIPGRSMEFFTVGDVGSDNDGSEYDSGYQ